MTNHKYRLLHLLTTAGLIFLAMGINVPAVFAQTGDYPYKIKFLTVDEGLSHTDANDIAQDQKGFIWIATYFGLDRFDGYTIKKFYNSNEPLKNAYKNRLRCVYPDDNGDIWLGTEGGLQRFDVHTERYIDYRCENQSLSNFEKLYKPSANKIYVETGNQIRLFEIRGTLLVELKLPVPANLSVSDFVVDSRGEIFLATSNGVWLLDQHDRLSRVEVSGLTNPGLNHISISDDGNLNLISGNQFFLATPASNQPGNLLKFAVTNQFTSPFHNEIKNVIRDGKHNFWVNEGGSLMQLNSDLHLVQVLSSKNHQQALNSNALARIFIDRSQCLWICAFGGGVNYFDLNEKPFYTLQHIPGDDKSISGSYIRSVLANGNDLWLGTTDNGLNRYNLKTHTLSYYNTYNTQVRVKSDVITALTVDHDQNLWMGSNSGLEILDVRHQRILKPQGVENFPKYVIDVLATDRFGNIWFGNHTDRFGVINRDEKGVYHTKYYGEGFFILADTAKPQLMISSTHGLKRLIVDKEGNILTQFTYRATGKPNSLSSDYTYPVVKQNDSTYWVGTIGGGLDRLILKNNNAYSISTFGSHYGIFNDVESMELDNAGNIWMGGNGLEHFNPVTHTLIRYDKNDGLQGNSFKVGSSYKGQDGRLFFGGINGLNYFYPDQIHENTVAATPLITDILINNQHPVIQREQQTDNQISQSVTYCNKLKINYLQNNFVIFFSAMHFANPLKCKYRYKLTGFDSDWRYTDGKNPSAAYNNIDYTNYTFEVQASNDDGIWSKSTAMLTIVVTPPWWKSVVAKAFYVLLLLSILTGIYLYQARWYKLKRDIEVGKVNEKKREEIHRQREELHQQQLVFFTNISHEFRTPLTLIVGPLEHLIHENKDVHLDSSYQLILRNARRLMNLIAELMNFKKVADSVIRLQVRPLDIYQFCTDLYTDFENIALNKDIRYRLINNTGIDQKGALTGWFDVQVLEKILFNLLNNSFKYTENNGEVTLELFFDLNNFKPSFPNEFKLLNAYRADRYLYIRIADTGIGISAESIANIFERYYRISSSHIGSGVGLALVKSLAQLHKGDIYVYSERMAGTEIIIGIPWGENNYTDSEKVAFNSEVKNQLEPVDKSLLTPSEQQSATQDIEQHFDKRILIVEDNEELRRFLKQVFDKHYHIYEAEDGEKGLKIATEKIPDVIISDVMMPKMNGMEFCRVVKEKFETRHIPFIILSAKNAIDAKLEGMGHGADFYFAKPLSVDLLLLTVRNIFAQREVAKQRFLNDYLSNATELVQSEIDKDFFDKLIHIIDTNLHEIELDVDFLCKHLFVSRTKLYQKIKSISGQSVGEFIRTIRLKKSIEIMTHENVSMNEVADRVGMQSSSNFSRAFKKEYGKSPLQFMQTLKKTHRAV